MEKYILGITIWSFAIFGLVVFLKEIAIDLLACLIKIYIKIKKIIKY